MELYTYNVLTKNTGAPQLKIIHPLLGNNEKIV